MRWFQQGIFKIVPVLMLIAYAPLAQAQVPTKTPAAQQLQSCHKLCFTEGEKCVAQPGNSEPFCNTLEIGCVAACGACVGGFSLCVSDENKMLKFCQNQFNTCLEGKLTASRSLARPQIAFKGGDGLSQETAIVIDGAMNEFEGIMAESLWAARHHVDWRKRDQSLIAAGAKHFDQINYEAADGRHTIWYDITGFFAK